MCKKPKKPKKPTKLLNAKAFCFALVLMALSNVSFGQSITWQRILNNDYGATSKVLQTPDGGFAAIGSVRLNNEYKINLTKLDKYGNILWVKIYGIGYANARWAEITNDGGFIICGYSDSAVGGSKVYLVKTDSLGNLQWQRYYINSDLDQGNCIKQTPDNGFIIGCRTQIGIINGILIIKIDSLGNNMWQKIFNTLPKHSYIYELEILLNGYLICGGTAANNPESGDMYLIKINQNGDSLWARNYGGNSTDVGISIENLNYCYLIGGYSKSFSMHLESYLVKIDTSGSLIWQKTYSGTYSEECSSVKYRPGIGYILVGSADTANFTHTRALIKIVDTNGVLLKQASFFPADRGGWFNDLELSNDGGYIIGGGANLNSASLMYVAKTDSLLFVEPIGISVITQNIPEEFSISQNYPNPFNPSTNIKYEIPNDANVSIKVYDLLCREVFSVSEYKLAGSYEMMFDGSNLASGLYFYSIKAETSQRDVFTETKKMVLIK